MAERTYDDDEVGRILGAAAEMPSSLARVGGAEGATLGDIQRIAEEVGIDPANVLRAVRELDGSAKARPLDKPDTVYIERWVEGELPDEAWDEIVAELRRFSGRPGNIESRGGTREWTSSPNSGSTSLSATTHRGRTSLRLLGGSRGDAEGAGVLAVVFLLVAIPMMAALSHRFIGLALTFTLAMAIVCMTVATAYLSVQARRRTVRSEIEALSDRIERIVAAHSTVEPSIGLLGIDEEASRPKTALEARPLRSEA